nr:hypothetical protein [candidate division Zixibacteria bacterium]
MKRLFAFTSPALILAAICVMACPAQGQVGRCCYGTQEDLSCDMLTIEECQALPDMNSWEADLNCQDNPCIWRCCQFKGDVNGNGSFNILDITYLVAYLYKSGTRPPCFAEADFNCDCLLNIRDITAIIYTVYRDIWPSDCTCEDWYDNCGEDPR